MLPAVMPAFLFLAAWYALAGIGYGLFGIETKGRSFEEIDAILDHRPLPGSAARRVSEA
jgi:hypothetical protein